MFFSVPLSVEMAPLPDFRSPCQTAEALRCMIEFSCTCDRRSRVRAIRNSVTGGLGYTRTGRLKHSNHCVKDKERAKEMQAKPAT